MINSKTHTNLYEAIFHGVNDAIVIYNLAEGGKVLDANPQACELFDRTYEEWNDP